jgi:hypothetical protein
MGEVIQFARRQRDPALVGAAHAVAMTMSRKRSGAAALAERSPLTTRSARSARDARFRRCCSSSSERNGPIRGPGAGSLASDTGFRVLAPVRS